TVKVMTPERVAQAILALTPAAFPSGTRMLFQQEAAPVGWTRDETQDDKALRVVDGLSGVTDDQGATAFSSVFGASKTTGSTVLTTAQLASHSHTERGTNVGAGSGNTVLDTSDSDIATNQTTANTTAATGSGSGHTHTLSMNLQYVDVIIAT